MLHEYKEKCIDRLCEIAEKNNNLVGDIPIELAIRFVLRASSKEELDEVMGRLIR